MQHSSIRLPSHESYGQIVVKNASELLSLHVWFKGDGTTLKSKNSRVDIPDAQVDGLIGENIVVEIEAGGKKKYRAAIMDLWLHKRTKKLLVIMTAGQLGKKSNRNDWEDIAGIIRHECTGIFDALGVKKEDYSVVVLNGHRYQGSDDDDRQKDDILQVRRNLEELLKP